jgi:hypothetical protein
LSIKFKCLFGFFTILLAAGLCAAIPLLVNLILYSIDPSTHFYYDNAKLVPFVDAMLIILTVALLVPLFVKRVGKFEGFTARQPVIAVFSALLGLSLCLSAIYDLVHTFTSGGAGAFLTGLTGLLAAIFFFAFTTTKFNGGKADLRLLALLPVVWGVINLVSTFMSLTQIANISIYLYEVLQMVFAILFLYYHARFAGNITNRREINGMFAFGLPCAFYGIASTLPQFIAHAIDHTKGRSPAPNDAVFLAMSLYIIVLLITLLVQKSKPEVSQVASTQDSNPA